MRSTLVRVRPTPASLLAALALVVLVPGIAPAQDATRQRERPEPRWSIEGIGGWAKLSPSDLNAYSLEREAASTTYYEGLVKAYQSLYGQAYSGYVTKKGNFPLIDRSWSGGVRVSYRISGRVAATAGVEYLSQRGSESVQRAYSSSLTNPNAVSFVTVDSRTTEYSESRLSVRSYAAMASLRWTVVGRGPLRIDAFGGGGLAWGRCEIVEAGSGQTSLYRFGTLSSLTMQGHGVAATGEAGLRAGWAVSARWSAFVEASYLRQRFSTITGSLDGKSKEQDGDATSPEKEYSGTTSGRWRMAPYSVTTAYASLDRPYPTIGNDQYPPFSLDLSGTRIRVGIALRLH